MKVRSAFLMRLHLDQTHYLLTARGYQLVREFFLALDTRQKNRLDDVQFLCFMKAATNLSDKRIYGVSWFENDAAPRLLRASIINQVFDMFDPRSTGWVDFESFYLLVCMLVAIKVDCRHQHSLLY
jgi:hypothetical protein